MKRISLISLAILIFIILASMTSNQINLNKSDLKRFQVKGIAIAPQNNRRLPGEDYKEIVNLLENAEILAVKGKLKPTQGEPTIPLKSINQTNYKSKTNKKGEFIFNLNKGIYTFLIITDKKAYNNSFTEEGYFEYHFINKNLDEIVIKDTRNFLF